MREIPTDDCGCGAGCVLAPQAPKVSKPRAPKVRKPRAPKFPASAIVYCGPSRFTGKPIVAIVTGLDGKSDNEKTGPMAQVYFLPVDVSPTQSIKTGDNKSVCNDCSLMPVYNPLTGKYEGPCYVVVAQAPSSIYRAYKRGSYKTLDPAVVGAYLLEKKMAVRFGAWGEPTSVPVEVLTALAPVGVRFTGYTHQWTKSPEYRHLLMASVDTPGDFAVATATGWRTFRTRFEDSPVLPGEIMCPASEEMGYRAACNDCLLCDGMHGTNDRRKNITIIVHGSTKVHYVSLFKRDSAGAVTGVSL